MSDSDATHEHSRLAAEITGDLLPEFPHIAVGRIIAVVGRAMADLRRVAVGTEAAASEAEYRRVITDTARHHLRRL